MGFNLVFKGLIKVQRDANYATTCFLYIFYVSYAYVKVISTKSNVHLYPYIKI